jgi:hypothetical protein
MKMTPEHYAYLEAAIRAVDTPELRAKAKGWTPKRYRWNLTYIAKLSPWICSTLYKYLDDDHIDTALRRIVPDLV